MLMACRNLSSMLTYGLLSDDCHDLTRYKVCVSVIVLYTVVIFAAAQQAHVTSQNQLRACNSALLFKESCMCPKAHGGLYSRA